jgi:hypothetical protein
VTGDSPRKRTREFLVGSLTTGVTVTVFVGLVTSPAVAFAVEAGPVTGGYAALAVFSLGILASQFSVWNDAPDDGFAEYGPATSAASVLGAVLYFNGLVAVTVWLAGLVSGPAVGGTVALVFPLYDRWIVRRGVPLSPTGLIAVAVSSLGSAVRLADDVSWREVRPELFAARVLPLPRRRVCR